MPKKVILTGLRANNNLHIGNYLGALLPLIDMANEKSDEYQVNLFVPDLHSFTTPINHDKLKGQINESLRMFVAAGLPLDNDSVHIYRQSRVPAQSELTVILNNFAYMGQLSRMNQFKEKSQYYVTDETYSSENRSGVPILRERISAPEVSVGLFDYPVLMAADILIYGATYVPVGDDQRQHLEFTRDIAERMNNKFGGLFVVPEPVKKQHEFFAKDQGLRIKDLQDPSKKMSKSTDSDKGVIFLSDDPEQARKKIMSAETDSVGEINHNYDNQPGVTNLLDIYQHLGGNQDDFIGQEQYGDFKKAVAEKVSEFLDDFQGKLNAVDDDALEIKLQSSEKLMNEQANQTLHKVQKAIGLR